MYSTQTHNDVQTFPLQKSRILFTPEEICEGIQSFREKTSILYDKEFNRIGIALKNYKPQNTYVELGTVPELYPEWLGDRSFQETHHVRFPYICGEMANGIASVEMVIAAAKSGLLAFFGSAGLSFERVRTEIKKIQTELSDSYSWGSNLIHSPHEIHLEQKLVDLYLEHKVKRISASAFMRLSAPLVQYACKGLHEKNGNIIRAQFLFAKISRPELAKHFMSPAPQKILDQLVKERRLTETEAQLASRISLSEDITVEADSAGHTDNQVLPSILSAILELRNELQKQFHYTKPIRVGAAGGIGSPNGAAAAFAMGAAYIMTGTVNQACVESGLHPHAKKLLEAVKFGDTMMCPASDMFELGVKLQVLKRGTMYGVRAQSLYEIYKTYDSIKSIPSETLKRLEKEIFRQPIESVWNETKAFWSQRDPQQIQKAEHDPKHHMALVFRYYLGLSSKWAISGVTERQFDYQIWCGPAQAAFNHWTRDSFLSKVEQRTVSQVAFNILEGAAQIQRAQQLRSFGVPVAPEAFEYKPRYLTLETRKQEDLSHVH